MFAIARKSRSWPGRLFGGRTVTATVWLGLALLGAANARGQGCPTTSANYPCAYVSTANGISVVNLAAPTAPPTQITAQTPANLTVSPDNSYLWAITFSQTENSEIVSPILTATGAAGTAITNQTSIFGSVTSGLQITASGRYLYVPASTSAGATLEYIDTSTNPMTAKFVQSSAFNSYMPFNGLNGGSVANGNVYFADMCQVVSVDTAPSVPCISAVSTSTNAITAAYPLTGSAYTQLVNSSNGITAIGIFVPPGQSIAYVGLNVFMQGPPGETTELATVDLNSGTVESLTIVESTVGNNIVDLIGSPDGSKIYISAQTATPPTNPVYVVNTATGAVSTLVPTLGNTSSSSGDLALSPDGTTLYVATGDGIAEYNTQTLTSTGTIALAGAVDIAIMHSLPTPLINQPLSPNAAVAGSKAFTLTVNGAQFAPGAVVRWNGTALTTSYVSPTQVTAAVPAASLTAAGTVSVTVINPGTGEIASNTVYFSVTSPTAGLTFSSSSIKVGAQPELLLSADFNHDGKPDLAAVTGCGTSTSCTSGTVSVLLGSASGLSAPGTAVSLGAIPVGAVAGDFNGDDNPDVVTLNTGTETASISYLQGDGAGKLVLKSTTALNVTSSSSLQIAAGDFNHDGILDLAVFSLSDGVAEYEILVGTGNGSFVAQSRGSIGGQNSFIPISMLTGDFNGDGLLDVAVMGSSFEDSLIEVIPGNGDGTFGSQLSPLSFVETPTAFASGDFNGDGVLDLAVAANNGTILLLTGVGDGTFALSQNSLDTGGALTAIGTADLNGDNKLDLLAAESGTPGSALAFLGAGAAEFGTQLTQTVGAQPQSVAIADFNDDGRLDVAVGNSDGTVTVLLQDGVASLDKATIGFGSQYDGTTSAPLPVTISNTGSASLSFGPVSITGTNAAEFTETNTCTGSPSLVLAPGASCTVQMAFAPTASGAATASLSFGLAQTGTTVALTGTGVAVAITTQPQSQTIPVNTSATLQVVATGLAGLTYQWYQGQSGDTSKPINGATSASYRTAVLTATTSYWVQVAAASTQSPTGSEVARSNTATITVVGSPVITTQPQSQTIAVNNTATLTVAATSNATLTYQWYIGASGDKTSPISGATGSTYTTPALTTTTSYWVLVSAAIPGAVSQTIASNTATITVVSAPVITVQPRSQSVVLNGTAQLAVTATSNSTLSYQWYAGVSGNTTNAIAGATGATYTTPALTSSTNYWVLVKAATQTPSAQETTASATAAITVIPPPTITGQPQSQSIAVGRNAVLTVTATDNSPLSYQWYVGASGDKTNPISGATAATYTTPSLSASASYWVLVSVAAQLPGGPETTASSTAVITVVPAPVITAQPQSQTIYFTQPPVALSVTATSSNSLTYQWYQGNSGNKSTPAPGNSTSSSYTPTSVTVTTSYWVLITDSVGNTVASSTAVITVVPDITTQPVGVQISSGGTATLTVAVANGEPGVSYQWYESTGGATASAIDSATGPSYTTPSLTATTAYWVAVSNASGTVNSNPAVVTVGAIFPGQSTTTGLVVPNNLQAPLNSNIELSCTSVMFNGGPAVPLSNYNLSCDLSPESLLNSTAAQPITVTIGTSSGSTTAAQTRSQGFPSQGYVVSMAGMALFSLGFFIPLRHRRRFARYFVLTFLAVGSIGLMSCGGHFKTTTTVTGTTGSATPAGSYAVVITAIDSQAPSAFQQTSLIVPLTVSPASN